MDRNKSPGPIDIEKIKEKTEDLWNRPKLNTTYRMVSFLFKVFKTMFGTLYEKKLLFSLGLWGQSLICVFSISWDGL